MLRNTLFACLATVTLGWLAPVALAQPMVPGGGPQRPTFSPYLQLLNRGGSPALNYLGVVRPQQQLAQQLNQLQQQNIASQNFYNDALNQDLNDLANLLQPTGNVAVFNNTGNYFNRYGSSFSSGVGGLGGGGMNRGGFNSMRPSFAGPRPSAGAGLGGFGGGLGGGLRR